MSNLTCMVYKGKLAMDAHMVRPKKQQLYGGVEMVAERKGLSDLPDVVIIKVISSLPTKDAIRTSILSKRWEYLWTSIPSLEFIADDSDRSLFVNIVDRALFLRGPSDIEKFHLNILSWIAVLLWFIGNGTHSIVHQQSWIMWYSVNYQGFTLPLFWYMSAIVLQYFFENPSKLRIIFIILQV